MGLDESEKPVCFEGLEGPVEMAFLIAMESSVAMDPDSSSPEGVPNQLVQIEGTNLEVSRFGRVLVCTLNHRSFGDKNRPTLCTTK